MRFIVLGAGAVGGVVGGRLFQHRHEVVLVARGEHGKVLAEDGLTLVSATGVVTLPVPATDSLDSISWRGDEVVLMAVKSQDTEEALRQLGGVAPPSVTVVCAQNGVANEPAALRRFPNIYGICVMCPAAQIEPGVVVAESSPLTALLDIGRYPGGVDATAEAIAAAISESTMESVARPDIMRWKYAKLLSNLSNAVDALCGPGGRSSEVSARARQEGENCLVAAGIDYASREEDRARRGDRLHPTEVVGRERGGSSTWQSLLSRGTVEVDYLNGEVVLLGRLHGVPVPTNVLLQHLVNEKAWEHSGPGAMNPEELLAVLDNPAPPRATKP
jgi:2-dehydropantoate 2-reductase